jgi:cobalt-zinc-cadmium efflux system outer membrane protein
VETVQQGAEVEVMDAAETLRTAKRNLGVLLGLSWQEAESLHVRGTIHDVYAPPPAIDELIGAAVECRPDVVAYRLGVGRACAEVRLAQANRYSDVYLLYQPYTFQNNAPFNRDSAHSWAVGVTVPLPVFDRNQGNIQKAKVNVDQSRIELSDRELTVANEVRHAEREYSVTRAAMDRIEGKQLPAAAKVRDDSYRLFVRGEHDAVVYLNAQREYNEAARLYRDMLVRHRRSMLRLNTAVGQRLLP